MQWCWCHMKLDAHTQTPFLAQKIDEMHFVVGIYTYYHYIASLTSFNGRLCSFIKIVYIFWAFVFILFFHFHYNFFFFFNCMFNGFSKLISSFCPVVIWLCIQNCYSIPYKCHKIIMVLKRNINEQSNKIQSNIYAYHSISN